MTDWPTLGKLFFSFDVAHLCVHKCSYVVWKKTKSGKISHITFKFFYCLWQMIFFPQKYFSVLPKGRGVFRTLSHSSSLLSISIDLETRRRKLLLPFSRYLFSSFLWNNKIWNGKISHYLTLKLFCSHLWVLFFIFIGTV